MLLNTPPLFSFHRETVSASRGFRGRRFEHTRMMLLRHGHAPVRLYLSELLAPSTRNSGDQHWIGCYAPPHELDNSHK